VDGGKGCGFVPFVPFVIFCGEFPVPICYIAFLDIFHFSFSIYDLSFTRLEMTRSMTNDKWKMKNGK
jgi:hypothetical protein